MTPFEVAEAFRRGAVVGPRGPVQAEASLLTPRALLVFTANTVLKMRRPVRTPDDDQTNHAGRLAAVERERWIGRRMAPAVYLGDAMLITDEAGGVTLATGLPRAEGEPVVAMTRLPAWLRADVWMAEHPTGVDDLAPVIAGMAAFHEDAPLHRRHDEWGAPGRTTRRWEALLAALAAAELADGAPLADGAARQRLGDRAAEQLEALDDVLTHRVTEGRIRHVHGDVRLEHVFLTEPPVIIDPADGDDARHWTDTAEDVALLAVELARVGRPELAAGCLEVYAGIARDRTLTRVAPVFQRLVAVRRALASWHDAGLVTGDAGAALRDQARRYLALALAY